MPIFAVLLLKVVLALWLQLHLFPLMAIVVGNHELTVRYRGRSLLFQGWNLHDLACRGVIGLLVVLSWLEKF